MEKKLENFFLRMKKRNPNFGFSMFFGESEKQTLSKVGMSPGFKCTSSFHTDCIQGVGPARFGAQYLLSTAYSCLLLGTPVQC
jgi:hypothetical protein